MSLHYWCYEFRLKLVKSVLFQFLKGSFHQSRTPLFGRSCLSWAHGMHLQSFGFILTLLWMTLRGQQLVLVRVYEYLRRMSVASTGHMTYPQKKLHIPDANQLQQQRRPWALRNGRRKWTALSLLTNATNGCFSLKLSSFIHLEDMQKQFGCMVQLIAITHKRYALILYGPHGNVADK